MFVIACIWALLIGYALTRGRSRPEPPQWWTMIAAANVAASIALGIIYAP